MAKGAFPFEKFDKKSAGKGKTASADKKAVEGKSNPFAPVKSKKRGK